MVYGKGYTCASDAAGEPHEATGLVFRVDFGGLFRFYPGRGGSDEELSAPRRAVGQRYGGD